MDAVTKVINHIEKCANDLNINNYTVDFEEEFNGFLDLFNQIKERVSAISNYVFIKMRLNSKFNKFRLI